jgi:membrane dipeptidase
LEQTHSRVDDELAAAARRLHADAIVVDNHLDLLMTVVLQRQIGARGSFADRWLPELRAGGVNVQVAPVYCEGTLPAAQLHDAMRTIAAFKREVTANAEAVRHCRTGAEIREALAKDQIAMVLSFEGGGALQGDPSLVPLFYELGVRMIGFTLEGRTALGDGSGENPTGSRLSSAGVEVFRGMEQLGIVMDVSHLGIRGVEHVLELATRPVIASHSGAWAVHSNHRNLTDEQIRAIAANGGVICAVMLPCFVDPERPTLDRLVDHIEHLVAVGGAQHVGLGSDFFAEIADDCWPAHMWLSSATYYPPKGNDLRVTIPGLHASRDLANVTETMLRRGFSEADIRGILGSNAVRVFDAVMGVPAGSGVPAARG